MTDRATRRTPSSLTLLVAALAIAATLALALLSSGTPNASAGQDWQSCPAGVQPPCPVAGKKPGTMITAPQRGYDWA